MLVFPDALKVDDDSVNRFVTHAMTVCASGRYEAFRLLWSAREEPLPRGEYERGWQAVQRIRVRLVQKIKLAGRKGEASNAAAPQVAYVVCAAVHLDTSLLAGRRKPDRNVVVLVLQEQGEWRLARAPAKVRKWVKARLEASATTSDGPATTDSDMGNDS